MTVEEIHKQLHNLFMKACYLFLQWALPLFTNLNTFFQSEEVIITNMHTKMVLAYKDLLGCYMKRDYVVKIPLQDVNPADTEQFTPITNLYLGVRVMKQIELEEVLRANRIRRIRRHPDLVTDFKTRCRDFLSTGCIQIKKRYEFNDPVLTSITILTPEKALALSERDVTPSLIPLTNKLPRICPATDLELHKLNDEWRQMPLVKFPEEIIKETKVDVFWDKINKYKDSLNVLYFEVLPSFALAVLSIPHSNAEYERIFSKVNLIKTKTRNRLITTTITGAILSSECIKGKGEFQKHCCQQFTPTQEMYSRITAANLYANNNTEKLFTEEHDSFLPINQ